MPDEQRTADQSSTDQTSADRAPNDPALRYRLCPRCGRAVPLRSEERYCINDGTPLLEGCPACGVSITSPYARHCAGCGAALTGGPGQAI